MSRTSTLLMALVLLPILGAAQSFQIVAQTDTVKEAIGNDFYYDVNVDILNKTGGNLTLAWEVLDRKENDDWDFSLCDFGNCHVGVPESGEMFEMTGEENAFLKLSAHPQGNADMCYFTFKVFDKNNPDDVDTITLVADAISSSIAVISGITFDVWPNPASNQIMVQSAAQVEDITILNPLGQVVISVQGNHDLFHQININALEAGQYVIVLSTKKGLSRASFLKP